MILAVDVQYDPENRWARTGGVVFRAWEAAESVAEFVTTMDAISPYKSGAFYRRELPCLLPLIQDVMSRFSIETIVIDGFVDLANEQPGLGRHLYDELGGKIQVLGVAKNHFNGASAARITRGTSRKPLWISSTADRGTAAACVSAMVGDARIPSLLKRADALARGNVRPVPWGNEGISRLRERLEVGEPPNPELGEGDHNGH